MSLLEPDERAEVIEGSPSPTEWQTQGVTPAVADALVHATLKATNGGA